ncbi:MAG TPA: cytochrome c oxidase subunit I [Acidimicrobiales bacterium]|nr:cytochrome c oxidase subunit I [Acidimicrobiales bacterium]
MTTVLEPDTDTTDAVEAPAAPGGGLMRRPRRITGALSWFTTIDHKRIGILYGVTSFTFFLLGGIEALLLRLQLARPNGNVLSAEMYNQLFTMHGTTMVFLVVMPLSAAFANYLIPLMIGARDVAFPRLNAFSYWCFLLGGSFLYSSFFLGGAPDGGWFGYAPNTSITFSPGHNIDFWVFGLQILGVASTTGAVNLIVTALNMRAPGMTLLRMPIFVWMSLVAQFLTLFALPVITIALFLLMFDRLFGANFFNPGAGGDPVLWQHLFWIFGHPEVYILILPAMGIVSEIIPVFARKPLFGYAVMVFSGVAIGFMGWGVWVHHMFSVGLGPYAVSAFSVSTMFIAVPTGVKIFNWLGTLWGGSLRFTTPMLFAVGFIAMFTIGGLSGVTHAISPHDRQQTDTYYVVAHFHYVLFGGALFGLMGGFYYWWPKVFGHMLSDRIGKVHFWLWFLGFNLTFGPMHILGLQGMPRRIDTYAEKMGFDAWNMVATVGAFVIALSVLVFLVNVAVSRKNRTVATADPWDGRTLEWSIPSPSPYYNFADVPQVHSLDEWWHRKYTEDDSGRLVRLPEQPPEPRLATDEEVARIHLPSPSYFPLIAAFGLPVMAYGMMYKAYAVAVIGAVILIAAIYAWGFEPSAEPEESS